MLGDIEDVLAHTVEGTEDQPREQHGPKEGCMVYSQEPRSYVKTIDDMRYPVDTTKVLVSPQEGVPEEVPGGCLDPPTRCTTSCGVISRYPYL